MTAENRLPCGQLEPAALWAAERTRRKDAKTCCCSSQRIKWTVRSKRQLNGPVRQTPKTMTPDEP